MTGFPSSGMRPERVFALALIPTAFKRRAEKGDSGSGERVRRAHTETSKVVLPVDVHGAASADALTATPPEHERRVVLVLDLEQRVEHHLARLVQVQLVVHQPRPLRRVVRVPAVDLEGLHALRLLLRRRRVAHRRHGAGEDARGGADGGGVGERGAQEAGG